MPPLPQLLLLALTPVLTPQLVPPLSATALNLPVSRTHPTLMLKLALNAMPLTRETVLLPPMSVMPVVPKPVSSQTAPLLTLMTTLNAKFVPVDSPLLPPMTLVVPLSPLILTAENWVEPPGVKNARMDTTLMVQANA